jgi:hypothetical protein
MVRIIMNRWKEGLQKVSLAKLQAELLDKSLAESKRNVDLLLEGKKVEIDIDDDRVANIFLRKANEIGVDCVKIIV